jgi:hypothetical protein
MRRNLLLLALGMAMATELNRKREVEVAGISGSSFEERQQKKGLKFFRYPDGFTCWATNQKTANKKHNKQTRL